MMIRSSLLKALWIPLVCVATAHATSINFVNFSTVSGLTLNGNASQSGDVLRLTPAQSWQSGSAFSTSTLALNDLNSFSTRFQFQITGSGGISDADGTGADGIVFVVQTVSNNVGGAGVGIGYQGISPSLGIEFDTYNNGSLDDNSGNHVGINLNGNINSVTQTAVLPRFNDGNIWTSWIDYNGATNELEVRFNQTGVRPDAVALAYSVNLSALLGSPNAYVGFTSGTGAAWGNHDILNWQFDSSYAPIGSVPDEAGTLPLIGAGLALLGWLGRGRLVRRN